MGLTHVRDHRDGLGETGWGRDALAKVQTYFTP
jgi:hypothetical protein